MLEGAEVVTHLSRSFFLTPKGHAAVIGGSEAVTDETARQIFGKPGTFWFHWFRAIHLGHKNIPGARLIYRPEEWDPKVYTKQEVVK